MLQALPYHNDRRWRRNKYPSKGNDSINWEAHRGWDWLRLFLKTSPGSAL